MFISLISLSVIPTLQFAVILFAIFIVWVGMRASHQVSIGRKTSDTKISLYPLGWTMAFLGGLFFSSELIIPLDIPWKVVALIGFLICCIAVLHQAAAHSQLVSLPLLLKKSGIFHTLGILSTIGYYSIAYFISQT